MKKHLITSLLMTIATTVLLGLVYPLVVWGLAQVLFHDKANGQIITRNGEAIGSRIIAQPFTGVKYFHPRPSAAGNGYDAANSGGTNLGPTNQKLIDRVQNDAKSLQAENPAQPIPVDLITTSASGLDQAAVRDLVQKHTAQRDLGLLGEPRVNVLELNLALDDLTAKR
jgi:K+-transporting ATPase ATPase C chain